MTEKHKTGPHAEFGQAVHTLCQLNGWTTNDVHKETGVAVSTLDALFNGECSSRLSSTRKVLAKLGISAEEAVKKVAARADEINRIKVFPHIIRKYRDHKEIDKTVLAKQLFPDAAHPNVKYDEMEKGERKPNIQEVIVMLKRLGKKDIFELIADAGLYAGHGASHAQAESARRGREQSRSTER